MPRAIEMRSGTLTIDGYYLVSPFENQPTVTASSGFFSYFSLQYYSSDTVQVSYTVNPNAVPGQQGSITVDNGFGQDSYEIAIPGSPQFTLNGSVITDGATQTVFAGQRVSLSIAAPAGYSLASQTWSFSNSSDAIDGYTASAASGAVEPMPSLTQDAISFYFVNVNQTTETVKCHYVLQNGDPNGADVTVTFNVQGPTANGGTFFSATPGVVNVWPANQAFGCITQYPGLEFGNSGTVKGMEFNVTANTPSGNAGFFQWVQLITEYNIQVLSYPARSIPSAVLGLDNHYPYQVYANNPTFTGDSPGIDLILTGGETLGEAVMQFGATMYLMWDPSMNSAGGIALGCAASNFIIDGVPTSTPSSCTGSIPVPLAYAEWGFSGCAINTLSNQPSTNTQWLLQCPTASASYPTVQPSSIYKTWSTTFQNIIPQ